MAGSISSSVAIVAYLTLFAGAGAMLLLVSLLIGRFIRPADPQPEKAEVYECGEPTIGSSFVQFDLRFYVVALLFIIFDVEVAFFFPWAVVFGKSVHLMDKAFVVVSEDGTKLSPDAEQLYQELGVRAPTVPAADRLPGGEVTPTSELIHSGARQLALVTILDILVFFAVLLVGFAYVWARGDLDWVRAMPPQRWADEQERSRLESAAEDRVATI